MDPRNTSSHQPFARPLSPPGVRNARLAPIPPPPYTLQAPLHASQPTPNHDPFLPRRNEHEEVRREQHKPLSQSPFSLGNYTTGLQREASGAAMENRDSVQENGDSWRFGDGRMGRYRSQSGDGKQLTLQYRQSLLIFLLFPHTESSVSLQSLAPSDHFSTQHKSIACIALLRKIHCTIQNMRIRINAVLKAQTFHTEDMFYGRTIRKAVISFTARRAAPCTIYIHFRPVSDVTSPYSLVFHALHPCKQVIRVISCFYNTPMSHSHISPFTSLDCFCFSTAPRIAIRHSGTALASGALKFSGGMSAEKVVTDALEIIRIIVQLLASSSALVGLWNLAARSRIPKRCCSQARAPNKLSKDVWRYAHRLGA